MIFAKWDGTRQPNRHIVNYCEYSVHVHILVACKMCQIVYQDVWDVSECPSHNIGDYQKSRPRCVLNLNPVYLDEVSHQQLESHYANCQVVCKVGFARHQILNLRVSFQDHLSSEKMCFCTGNSSEVFLGCLLEHVELWFLFGWGLAIQHNVGCWGHQTIFLFKLQRILKFN